MESNRSTSVWIEVGYARYDSVEVTLPARSKNLHVAKSLPLERERMDPAKFSHAVSATEPDWNRERIHRFWDPGRKLLRAVRRYQAAKKRGTPLALLVSKFWVANHWFWSLVTQSEIHLNCHIEGGLVLPHPTGIIIHPASRIGPNCLIFHQVTLAGPVELGGHCDIGAGAKIIGAVKLGHHVQVGANAVVTRDVPDHAIVAGIPARPITKSQPDSQSGTET